MYATVIELKDLIVKKKRRIPVSCLLFLKTIYKIHKLSFDCRAVLLISIYLAQKRTQKKKKKNK